VISDVQSQLKSGAVIGCLERSKHLKKVFEWILLSRHDTPAAFCAGEFGQNFGDVIRDGSISDVGAQENISDKNVEIEMRRDSQTTASF
jgi:hypothetical protein